MSDKRITRPHYKSPRRELDYLESSMRRIENAGYIFTPDEFDRLVAIYHRIHRVVEKLKRIPPDDFPYQVESDKDALGEST